MTEAEALAIAVKAIVSAFVTTEKKDEKRLAPRRAPKRASVSAPRVDIDPGLFPSVSGEILGEFTPPEVTVSELEAMFNSEIPPPGMYNKYAEDRDIPGWVA